MTVTPKTRLRQECLGRLRSLPGAELREAAKMVSSRLEELNHSLGAKVIAMYVAKDWEIDLLTTTKIAPGAVPQVALPRWNPHSGYYEFALLDDRQRLMEGRFGILEPDGDCLGIGANAIDLVLVPGLAFSPAGRRLGRGKGFYDQLLKPVDGVRVGVCHDFQLIEFVPSDEWDESVDGVLTPSGYIESQPDGH